MTEEERDEMMRSNYKAQLAALGYGPDGMALPREKTYGWISVKDRPPESGEPVLVTCEIHSLYGNKMRYVCEAFHAEKYSVREGKYPEDTDCYDYCEEDDEYYLKEGWYEIIHNWDEYGSVVIEDFVTHWMPRPEPAEEEE
jgi:hypothetical protein